LPEGKKDKNIICAKSIFGRLGLLCLRQAGAFPAYGRQASYFLIEKENKATGAIEDTDISIY
jgi:hypothetical protein